MTERNDVYSYVKADNAIPYYVVVRDLGDDWRTEVVETCATEAEAIARVESLNNATESVHHG